MSSPLASPGPLTSRTPLASPDPYSRRGLAIATAVVTGLVIFSLAVAVVGTSAPGDAGRSSILYTVLLTALTLTGAGVVVTAGIVHLATPDRRARYRGLAIPAAVGAGLLVLVLGLIWLSNVATAGTGYLLSLPTTAFAVWACRRLRTNRRPAWWLVGLGLVWGAVVAIGTTELIEGLIHEAITTDLLPGLAASIAHALDAAVVEEITKGLGVLVLILVFPRRLHGMLAGLVLGSAVGLGFQSAEAVSYMHAHLGAVLYQYWYRQGAGLVVSHATYTALTGAGIGLAVQQRDPVRRICCGLSGLAAALGAHLVWDTATMQGWLWTPSNPTLYLYVALPLMILAYKGPAFAAVIALSVQGNRRETRGIGAELRREADTGSGAVLPGELDDLVTPIVRRRARLRALLSGDLAAYRRLARLHRAQIELALVRLTRADGTLALPPHSETELRRRIHTFRHGRPPAPTAHPPLVASAQVRPGPPPERAPVPRPVPAGPQQPVSPPAAPLQPGDPGRIGPYRVVGRLGGGPVARTYLADAPDGTRVTVRLVWANLARDERFRYRFAQQMAAAWRAPATACVPVVAADPNAPVPWLATRYTAAPSLAGLVGARGPVPAIHEVAAGMAVALDAVHRVDLLHGGLTGATVAMTGSGPRLLDLGLTMALDPAAYAHAVTTAGDLGYVSPERLHSGAVTTAGDVYSLGATLYFAATGRRPDARPALDLVTDDALHRIITECLATDPDRRPTAADLAQRLTALRGGQVGESASGDPGPLRCD